MIGRPKLVDVKSNHPPAGYDHVVNGQGLLVHVPRWPHTSNDIVRAFDIPTEDAGTITVYRLTDWGKASGFSMLESLYKAEGREDDWAVFLQWWEHAKDRRAKPFPESRLPAEVLARRRKIRTPEMFEVPEKPAKPKRKRTA